MLVAPSPKFQDQPVTVPVDKSVNFHAKGLPALGAALKLAAGITAFAFIVVVVVLLTPEPVTVSVT